MNRTDVINYIAKEKGYKTYLEIGVQTTEQNFDKIKVKNKTGVDPNNKGNNIKTMKSDAFFAQNKEKFDLIFIDGDHSYKQSKKDFDNSLASLNDGGCIIMHDVIPDNQEYTKLHWCGEVWKTASLISCEYDVRTYKQDHGVLVVFPVNKIKDPVARNLIEYKGVEYLNKILKGVDNLEDLIPDKQNDKIKEINFIEEVKSDIELINNNSDKSDNIFKPLTLDLLNSFSDQELKDQYKELKGSGYRGKFNRDTCINKILEMQ